MQKIAIIDDFEESCQLMAEVLSPYFKCEYICDSEKALDFISTFKPDLILLDYKMPSMTGIDLCRIVKVNELTKNIPIIFVSGAVTDDERIETLETGADDFIAKPFHPKELLLRVKKRVIKPEEVKVDKVQFKNLVLDPKERSAMVDGQAIDLTPKQFDIIYLLATHSNSLVSRETFMEQVWGHNEVSPRNVDSQINYLKKKLIDFHADIESVSGYGYRLSNKKKPKES